MNSLKIFAVCLLLVIGVVSQDPTTSTFQSTEDHETYTSSSESPSTETVDNSLGTTDKPEKTNQTTDVDTKGDVVITGSPEDETENNHTSNSISTMVEINSTEVATEDSFTTLSEITTLQITWRACSSNPCKNGGSCIEDNSDPRVYTCKCSHGYTGTHCQVADGCFVDEDGNICSKGACRYEKDGLSRYCQCFFGMFWDEDMKKCRKAELPCFPNPCHNGTCIRDDGDFHCSCKSGYEGKTCEIRNQCGEEDSCKNGECKENSKKKLKYCECHSDFYWNEENKKCEAVHPPCLPNPCKNGGTCESITSEEFNCTCAVGYVGENCDIQNFCISSSGGITCENGFCIDSELSKICSCNEGYFWDAECRTCREIMEPCLPNPCSNDGKCTPLSMDSYNCTCSEGYSGSRCTENDYCALNGGNTFCGDANCMNDQGLKINYCSCSTGQYFDYASRKCLDIDFCPLLKCGNNEECRDSKCQCKENYKRDNSTKDCEPDFCPSNPCPVSDLICNEGDGIDSYECACEKGYAFDGNRCKAGAACVFPDLNACGQICTPEEEGYTCSCEEDFLLNNDNKTCGLKYSGNSTNCSNKTCDNGICISFKEHERERCICGPGFEEVEDKCVDLCTARKLPEGYCPDNECEATDSGFKCKCEGKYTYSNDGITCKVRKLCDEGEVGWKSCSKRHALCIEDWEAADGFKCKCIEGQVATEGGICRDICSIEENQRQCSILGAECDVNSSGEKTCKCPPYFLPFENGTTCSKAASNSYILTLPLNPSYKENGRSKRSLDMKFADVDYLLVQRDVRRAMDKLFPQLLFSNVLNCRENKGYIKCKVELQFVLINDEDLKKLQLSEVCHATKDSSSACLVPPSLILQKEHLKTVMSIQRTDPCDADIKEDLCGSETFCASKSDESIFKCRCEAGFSVRGILYPFGDSESFIENCKDIDECAIGNPCRDDNMECHNSLGSYTCSCKPGYRAKDISEPETSGCVEICNPNPCVHGDCIKIGDHYFECKCSPGYNGLLCDLQDENFKRARTNTIIVGAVLAGGLLVVIILSIASISRLKKKKEMLENSGRMLYGTEMTERRGGEAGAINNAYQRD